MSVYEKFCQMAQEISCTAQGTWNIGFLNCLDGHCDETQFDLDHSENIDDLWTLWQDFCKENGFAEESFHYIEKA